MLTYTIRRLILAIPVLLLISLIIFMLLKLAPGDPTAQMPLTIPPDVKEKMKEAMGFNKPLLVQ
ncbi:MAG: ABC transporter permease, partial [Paracoccaceae bacterium]|nr:ABC transporter permease [Paracoccaceae bacterium]